MRLRFIVLGGSIGSLLIAQACGGDVGTVDGGPDGATNDATVDVVLPNDSGGSDVNTTNDTGPTDGGSGTDTGTVDAGSDSGGGLGITSWMCGTAIVSDCSACIGYQQPCVYCSNADASVRSGVCVEQGTGCGNTIPPMSNLCACPRDAGACPAPYQVCLSLNVNNSVCDTCGAVVGTNGLTCENGGKCTLDAGCN